MRKMGLEPTRPCGHKILSLARLPIPTLPHLSLLSRDRIIVTNERMNVKEKFKFFVGFFVEKSRTFLQAYIMTIKKSDVPLYLCFHHSLLPISLFFPL